MTDTLIQPVEGEQYRIKADPEPYAETPDTDPAMPIALYRHRSFGSDGEDQVESAVGETVTVLEATWDHPHFGPLSEVVFEDGERRWVKPGNLAPLS